MGAYGTAVVSDAELLDLTGYVYGYPERAICANGDSGYYSDCPGTGGFPGSTYRYNNDTSPPFSGAEIWGAANTIVEPGDHESAHTIDSAMDTTIGQSGAALYYLDGGYYAIGWLSSGDKSNFRNVFHRWNSETFNFVANHTDYPNDL